MALRPPQTLELSLILREKMCYYMFPVCKESHVEKWRCECHTLWQVEGLDDVSGLRWMLRIHMFDLDHIGQSTSSGERRFLIYFDS